MFMNINIHCWNASDLDIVLAKCVHVHELTQQCQSIWENKTKTHRCCQLSVDIIVKDWRHTSCVVTKSEHHVKTDYLAYRLEKWTIKCLQKIIFY